MGNQLRNVYRAMLENDQVPVLPEMQRRIVEFAGSSKDAELLVSLLARNDIDGALERELSLSDDLEVLAAWASDPRRTSEALRERLEGETRVGALLPLARRRGLPDEVYQALSARRSVRIAEALAENMSSPDGVRAECLKFLVARPTWHTASTPHNLSRWMRNEDDVRTVVEHAVHLPHLKVAAESSHFSADLAETLASRLKGVLESSGDEYTSSWSVYPVTSILSVLRKFPLSEKARGSCIEVVDVVEKTSGQRSGGWGGRSPSTDRLREAFDPSIEGFDAFLRQLSDPSFDVRVAAGKAFSAASDDSERRLAVDALASRPNAPEDLLRTHFGRDASQGAVGALFSNLLSEERIDLLSELSIRLYGVDGGTSALVRDHPLGHDLVMMVSERCRDAEVGLPGWVRDLLRHDRFADLALEVAQWPELSDLLRRPYVGQTSILSSRVQELLLEEFGDEPERWRVFSEIAGSFSGSLRMLVQTVKTLS